MSTCFHCRYQTIGLPTTAFVETLPNGSSETRKFCSSECLQKYRLRYIQSQQNKKQLNNNSSAVDNSNSNNAAKNNTNNSSMSTTSTVNNGDSVTKPPTPVVPSDSSTTKVASSTSKVTSPAPQPPTAANNGDKSLSIDIKVDDAEVKVETTNEGSKCLNVSPSSVKSLTSELDNSPDGHVSPNSVDSKKSSKKLAPAKHPKVVPKHHYEIFSVFDWDTYLKEVGGTGAPPDAFKQSFPEIPVNEFHANMKLESKDPRNPSSTSIATVIYNIGPRVCLRLDGSDSSNDFYELVDSASIQPIGTCQKNGDMLQPPLGFQKNPSQWPVFVVNTLEGAEIAPDRCFKETPPSPKKNKFEVGMKLEAVDRKHPRMILPATVGDVKDDLILVSFDGWNGAGVDYWCDYRSRDIFPVGWCKKAGHPLQPPGDKAPTDKEKAKRMSTPSLMRINTGLVSPSNNGLSISPGSRRSAAMAATSPSLLSPKSGSNQPKQSSPSNTTSNSNNKVTTSHHQNGNASLKVPNLKISTSGKVPVVKTASNATNPNVSEKNNDTGSKKVSTAPTHGKPSMKTTARKSTGASHPPFRRATPDAGNQGFVANNSSKAPVRQVSSTRLQKHQSSDGDDTDTEVEESPVKKMPPLKINHQQQQSIRDSSAMKPSLMETTGGVKRPAQDPPPKKLSEIRPSKAARVANSNLPPSPALSPIKVEATSNSTANRGVSGINHIGTPVSSQSKAQSNNPRTPPTSNYPEWNIDDVVSYLISVDSKLDTHEITEAFREHEIDGKAFVLLTSDMMTRYMKLKLGPMLKILNIIEKLTGKRIK